MELDRIEKLVEKYFEAETSITEEKELKDYFASSDVAPHLEQYKRLFGYVVHAKQEQFTATLALTTTKRKSVEALAMTMTKNFCLDQLKSKRASNMTLVHSNYSSNEASLQKKLEDEDSLSWVEKIINNLPEQQRLIIQMRDIEQYEFEEIAKILEMNETAIRVALSRARKTIREFMTNTHNYGIN